MCGVAAAALLPVAVSDGVGTADAQSQAASSKMPDFGIDTQYAWHEIGDEFLPAPTGPKPVTNDPRYPYLSNAQAWGRCRNRTNQIFE